MYDLNEPDYIRQIEKAMAAGPMPSETLRPQVMHAVELKLGGSASLPVWQIVGAAVALMLLSWGLWVSIHNPGRPETEGADPGQRYQDMRRNQPGLTRDEIWQELLREDPALRTGADRPSQRSTQATTSPATHP